VYEEEREHGRGWAHLHLVSDAGAVWDWLGFVVRPRPEPLGWIIKCESRGDDNVDFLLEAPTSQSQIHSGEHMPLADEHFEPACSK
jgi:hypothetical protein